MYVDDVMLLILLFVLECVDQTRACVCGSYIQSTFGGGYV